MTEEELHKKNTIAKDIGKLYDKMHLLGRIQAFVSISLVVLQVVTVYILKDFYPEFVEAYKREINIFIWLVPVIIILTGIYVCLKTKTIGAQITKKIDELFHK